MSDQLIRCLVNAVDVLAESRSGYLEVAAELSRSFRAYIFGLPDEKSKIIQLRSCYVESTCGPNSKYDIKRRKLLALFRQWQSIHTAIRFFVGRIERLERPVEVGQVDDLLKDLRALRKMLSELLVSSSSEVPRELIRLSIEAVDSLAELCESIGTDERALHADGLRHLWEIANTPNSMSVGLLVNPPDAGFLVELREAVEWIESEHVCGEDARHSDDFHSVFWYGEMFTFTHTQAACIKVLWENWERGTPSVGEGTILEAAGSTSERLRDVFQKGKHPAWGNLIVTPAKGSFMLAEPKKF